MRLGRLACARGNQPYVVPIYFVYNHNYLFSFSVVGQKIEWMRTNPLVCVETGEIVSAQQWTSIIIFGRYEELCDHETDSTRRNLRPLSEAPKPLYDRDFAHDLLRHNKIWWEPGAVKTGPLDETFSLQPVYYRIDITQITGHRGIPDSVTDPHKRLATPKHENWTQRILRPFRAKQR